MAHAKFNVPDSPPPPTSVVLALTRKEATLVAALCGHIAQYGEFHNIAADVYHALVQNQHILNDSYRILNRVSKIHPQFNIGEIAVSDIVV
jgi:hypothetical protein